MVVPALVVLSLLVPLAFLLGLHNRFPAGFSTDDRQESESSFRRFTGVDREDSYSGLDVDASRTTVRQVDEDTSKTTDRGSIESADDLIGTPKDSSTQLEQKDGTPFVGPKDVSSYPGVLPSAQLATSTPPPALTSRKAGVDTNKGYVKGSPGDETEKSCQLEFGSYCLWSVEHKEVMKDSTVKRLKDQLFVARAYYPSIAKLQGQEQLTRELKQNIQELERMLSEAITDGDIPSFVEKNIRKMEQAIAKAKSNPVECNNVDKKLRQILDLTEDETHFHMKQSAFMYHLAVQTMPKSFHCLSMRLTVEHFKNSADMYSTITQHAGASRSRHHVIFSRNILAVSVVINSTVMSSEETGDMAFHVITDVENYYAMKSWFDRNAYGDAIINVLNFDELGKQYSSLDPQLSLSEEFRISIRDDQSPSAQIRTEYISVFGHSHFLLPEIFKDLKKVVVLDDDVVVQRDLSPLWNLHLDGKVIAAVEFCNVRFDQLKSYVGRSNNDDSSCLWMSGLNVIDLEKWREHDVTRIYRQFLQKLQDRSEASWRAAALPTSLLAFKNLIHPLDDSWILSGLGFDYGIGKDSVKSAAVLHYNGNMKPWLDLGIPKYKVFWKKFLTKQEGFMDECNVNP